MNKVDFSFNITLDESEFVKVGDDIYTTGESIIREEPSIHFICDRGLMILKQFEGKLNKAVVDEWLLLSKAMDQTCSYGNKWDDVKILQELIKGEQHPISWYVNHCIKA